MTIKAKCEVVADAFNSHHAKIGEEVRFYVDGVCVDTRRLHKPEDYGTFKVGEEYELEIELPKPAPSPPESDPDLDPVLTPSSETGPSPEKWGGREGDDLKPNDYTGNADSSPTGMIVPPTDA